MSQDTQIDDVPMLGELFEMPEDESSAPAVQPEAEPVPAPTDDGEPEEQIVSITSAAAAAGGVVTPPPPPAAPSPTATAAQIAGMQPNTSSPTFGTHAGAPTATAASASGSSASLSPTTTEVTPESLGIEEPTPILPWQQPLTPDEMAKLFAHDPLVAAAPRITLSALDTKKGAYSIDKSGPISPDDRDEQVKNLQATPAIPTSVRKIDNFSMRIRMNNELSRVAQQERDVIQVMGVTDSAKLGGEGLGTIIVSRLANQEYLRYAWSAYKGVMFGAEEVELGPDGKPLIKLEGHDAPLLRPNGELYFPRKIRLASKDTTVLYDTQMIKDAYAARIPVLLYGKPGTGKTALCEAVLPGLVTISGTADTETADFDGSYVQNPDGTFEWVDGPLLQAMRAGVPLFIDEIALIDSRVLARVYSVMDGRNEIVVTANPKMGPVKAEDGFYVIGACNPDVPGAVMSDALLSRFSLQVEVTTDYDMLKTLGVDRDIITVAKNLAKMAKSTAIMKAPETRELLAYTRIRKALGQPVALANLVASALPSDREEYKKVLSTKFDDTVEALAT